MANMTPLGPFCATLLRNQCPNLVCMSEHVLDRVDRAIVARLQRDGPLAKVVVEPGKHKDLGDVKPGWFEK